MASRLLRSGLWALVVSVPSTQPLAPDATLRSFPAEEEKVSSTPRCLPLSPGRLLSGDFKCGYLLTLGPSPCRRERNEPATYHSLFTEQFLVQDSWHPLKRDTDSLGGILSVTKSTTPTDCNGRGMRGRLSQTRMEKINRHFGECYQDFFESEIGALLIERWTRNYLEVVLITGSCANYPCLCPLGRQSSVCCFCS